jgi:hypothetical protein
MCNKMWKYFTRYFAFLSSVDSDVGASNVRHLQSNRLSVVKLDNNNFFLDIYIV